MSLSLFGQDEETTDYASSYFSDDEKPKKNKDSNTQREDFSGDALNMMDSMNVFRANFGITQIGDQRFVGTRLQPEIAIGKIGAGLDIPVFFNMDDYSFRTEEFKNGTGILRMIQYFRYGVKERDPVYLRAGTLTNSYIGYGILLNNYTNSTSYERRKIGGSFDIRPSKLFGLEGLYSDFDFSSRNLLALRPYIRPFAKMPIPVLRSMEMGGSYITDFDQTTQVLYEEGDNKIEGGNEFIKDGVKTWSADMGVTFLKIPFISVFGSVQYAKLLKNTSDSLTNYLALNGDAFQQNYKTGDGLSVGLNAKVNFIGQVFNMDARIDRLWYSDYFMPQFFDAIYEINKNDKLLSLTQARAMKGIYGSLTATLVNKIRLSGSLVLPDELGEGNPATVTLRAQAVDLFDKLTLDGSYIKGDLINLNDAFTLDNRSLAKVRAVYKVNKFIAAGIDYYWTFSKQEDGSFDVGNYVMPYFGLHLPLNFGGNKAPVMPEE